MKKSIKSLLSLMLVVLMIMHSSACVFAAEIEDVINDNEYDPISMIEEYMTVSETGNIVIDLPSEVASKLDDESYELLLTCVDEINVMLDDGNLEITDNGTIYEANDDELVIQGGNVNKVKWYWWGIRRYASKNQANKLANDMSKIAAGSGGVGTVAGFFSATPVAPVALVVSIGALYCNVRAGLLAADISYYNGLTDRGVIIDIRWILTYKVSCQ